MVEAIIYELDKPRYIKLTMKTICRIEALTGIQFMAMDLKKISTTVQTAIVWAGFANDDPDITLDQVYDLIDKYSDSVKLYEVVIKAVLATLPEKKPGEKQSKNAG